MYNDDELCRMLTDLESHNVERKESASDRSKIRRTICAFANDLADTGKPGVIFIGAKDNGECANLEITDDLMQKIAQMRSDGNILPIPSMTVEKKNLNGCELLVVIVQPSTDPPVRYQRTIWVRVGSTLQRASPEEEKRLAERRRAADLPFDHREASEASLDELDLEFFKTSYLPSAIVEDVLEQNRRGLEQQLRSLRFLGPNGKPNFGAILTLGKDPLRFLPGAYIQFARFDGKSLTDPIKDQKQLSGPLHEMLGALEDLMEINISTASHPSVEAVETRVPDYPIQALRQLARNAVMHRSYEGTNAPVRIKWFSDRVEILNPGGLYGQVNWENFGKGATDYRNPLIAEAMRVMGFVQRFGMGIPLAREELRKNGNPEIEFQLEPAHFGAIVRSR